MKRNRFTPLLTVAFGLAAFSTAGCAEKTKSSETSFPPAPPADASRGANASDGSPAIPVAATNDPAATSATWANIKDKTYDTRAQFFAGLIQLEARVDDQIRELTARRAAMTSTANTQEWDFAMKEMGNARSYLKSVDDESRHASPETWDQAKDKVGTAWIRTQDAYGKVKSSTTS